MTTHEQFRDILRHLGEIMAAIDDLNTAVTAQTAAVTELTTAVAAIPAGTGSTNDAAIAAVATQIATNTEAIDAAVTALTADVTPPATTACSVCSVSTAFWSKHRISNCRQCRTSAGSRSIFPITSSAAWVVKFIMTLPYHGAADLSRQEGS